MSGLLDKSITSVSTSTVLMKADHLTKTFASRGESLRAVDDVSFEIHEGKTLGVVGESGSGKTTIARLAMRLIEPTSGTLQWKNVDMLQLRGRALTRHRQHMQMVFQSPYGSLLPSYTALANVMEPLRIHSIGDRADQRARAEQLLMAVGLSHRDAQNYPRYLSGGQQQRVAIARALALGPQLLVCDEPTSALDTSIQAQIIMLLLQLRDELGFAMLFISHNLAVIERLADEVLVMRKGKVVERAPVADLLTHPQEQYTMELLDSVPAIHPDAGAHLGSFGGG